MNKTAGDRAIWLINNLTHTKGPFAGQSFNLRPWQQQIVRRLFTTRKDGVRQYRTCLLMLPRKNGKSELAAALAIYFLLFDGEAGGEVYCLDPGTRVLGTDLRWRTLDRYTIGDQIVGFDECVPGEGAFRKLRPATITAFDRRVQPCCRIEFDDGRTVIASALHRWLAKPYSANSDLKQWVLTKDLQPGQSAVRDLGSPWEEDETREAGYLAGIFDGEACFHRSTAREGFRISFAQRPGIVLDTTRQILQDKGFDISANRQHKTGVDTFEVRGLHDCLRFLGQVRPRRLLEQAGDWWDGKAPTRNKDGGHRLVTGLEYLGDREVIAIGTTTRTLFAEGFFSHNSAASDKDQAALVFNVAAQMIRHEAELEAVCEIVESQKRIVHRKSGSFYRAISAEAYSKHGFNASAVIYDELHAAPNRELWDVLATSQGARRQPLMMAISTAGYDRHSILWELYAHAKQVAENPTLDPTFLPVIYEAPAEADWTNETVWRQANPALGDFRSLEEMQILCTRAQQIPAQEMTFRRLYLNQWTESVARWVSLAEWDACQVRTPRANLRGRRCYVGMDLSSTKDLTALVAVFPDDAGGFDVLARFFVPQETIRERVRRDHVPYDQWVRDGHLEATTGAGPTVDYEAARQTLHEWAAEFDVREIAYDPWNATDLVTRLEQQDGFTCVVMRQGFASLSAPTKSLEKAILSRALRHTGDPILRWCVSNVAIESDAAGNVKISKRVSTEKIDGTAALVMAMDRLDRHVPDAEKEYQIIVV